MTNLEGILAAAATLVEKELANDDAARRDAIALLAVGQSPHVLQLLRDVPLGEVLVVLRKREA